MQRYRQSLNPEHQLGHLPMAGIIRSRIKQLFTIVPGLLVKSSETPSVETLENALTNYRAFIRKWHSLQEKQAARDQAGEKPASAS